MKISAKVLLITSSLAAVMATGCSIGKLDSTGSEPVGLEAATSTSGQVMGGQQPIAGMTLQIYVASTAGYGAASTAATTTFTTNASGNFTFPTITCPTTDATSQAYMIGTKGTPIGGTTNNNAALMVGLGQCSSIGSGLTSYVDMNEITTVATVWSLAPFMVDMTHIGTSATNIAGLQRAFATVNKIANVSTGATAAYSTSYPYIPANAVLPTAEIATLADILQACINSSGGVASDSSDGHATGTSCGKLFYLTTVSGVAPTDTVTAAMNIAHHPYMTSPANYVAYLNDIRPTSPAFQTPLNQNSPPTDWTISIQYTSTHLVSPQTIAVDPSGNVWVGSGGDGAGNGAGVTQLSAVGKEVNTYTAGGAIYNPVAIAIDPSGNVFVANSNATTGSVIALGTGSGTTAITGNGVNEPGSIAIDGSGNLFVGNYGASSTNTYSIFTNNGSTVGTFSPSGSNNPIGIAISLK